MGKLILLSLLLSSSSTLMISLVKSQCSRRDLGFELLTGFVFTAPDFILSTKPGVLLLEECISLCHDNPQCQSINYETGLCVLFTASAALDAPEALTPSQFPVFTLYAQKICVPGAKSRCPGKAWLFDRVAPRDENANPARFARLTRLTESREQCMSLCLASESFSCRAASFNRETGECVLSDVDRHTFLASTSSSPRQQQQQQQHDEEENLEYYESNCANEPVSVCQFKEVQGLILKTVDSVYANIASVEECRRLCIQANFRCHSFDFGDTGDLICRLSHHSRSTLSNIKEPFLSARGAKTYELGACYNVSVDCQASKMVARVSTNRMFRGRMYSKARPNSCHITVRDSLNFDLTMGYNDIGCDIHQDIPGRFTTDIVIQHHDTIVTQSDVGLKVRCNYNMENKTVSNFNRLSVEGNLMSETGAENTVVRSPNVTLRVTDRVGRDIESAKVGDPLALRFEIQIDAEGHKKSSPFEIFVRELVAMDGLDSSEILLIDDRGCPTDMSIMGVMNEVDDARGQKLQADFDAFKFPTSDVVQFRALVTPCIPRCDPVKCDGDFFGKTVRSFGRRRRRRKRNAGDDDLLVAGAIRISDKFENPQQDHDETEKKSYAEDHYDPCFNAVSLSIGATLFLLAQFSLISMWALLYKKKKIEDENPNNDAFERPSRQTRRKRRTHFNDTCQHEFCSASLESL